MNTERESILCVDDDAGILEGYRRQLSRKYEVFLARGPIQGLEKLEMGPQYAVILSDKRMPEMDGIEFLRRASLRFPMSSRIMLTGDADQSTAVDAINQGNIHCFLQKPCPSLKLQEAVEKAIQRYRDQKSAQGEAMVAQQASLHMLMSAMGWMRPEASQQGERVWQTVKRLHRHLGEKLPFDVEVAAKLCGLGLLTAPAEAWRKKQTGRKLNGQEEDNLARAHWSASELLRWMPAWGKAADLLLEAHGLRSPSPLGVVLKLALELEVGQASRPVMASLPMEEAMISAIAA